jgi:hypothetical protein
MKDEFPPFAQADWFRSSAATALGSNINLFVHNMNALHFSKLMLDMLLRLYSTIR